MQIMKEECIYNHLQAAQNRTDTTEISVYKKIVNYDTLATLLTDATKYNESSWLKGRIVAKCKTLGQCCPRL
jgi:hypothetical protein